MTRQRDQVFEAGKEASDNLITKSLDAWIKRIEEKKRRAKK